MLRFGVLEVVQVVAGRPTKLVLVEGTNVGMKVDETKADVEVIAIDQGKQLMENKDLQDLIPSS